jgi:rod shape determining protein RodA
LLFIVAAVILAIFVLVTDNKLYYFFAWFIYGIFVFLLLMVLVVGKEINGAKAWFEFGPFGIQPSEFAKFATGLALASYLNSKRQALGFRTMATATSIIMAPVILIAVQPDMGSVITYFAFFIVLFREGMSIYVFISALLAVILFLLTLIFGTVAVALGLIILSFAALWIFIRNSQVLTALGIMAGAGALSYLAGHYIFGAGLDIIIVSSVVLSGAIYAWYLYRYRLKMAVIIYSFLLGGILYLFTVDYAFHEILKPH